MAADLLMSNPPPSDYQAHNEYVQETVERLEEAHTLLKKQKIAIRQEIVPALLQTIHPVLVQNIKRKKGVNPKLQPMFSGP